MGALVVEMAGTIAVAGSVVVGPGSAAAVGCLGLSCGDRPTGCQGQAKNNKKAGKPERACRQIA